MAVDTINSNALTDSTVVAADIAPGTITDAKLAGSISNAKLSNSTVTINGESIALGASAGVPDVQWQSVVVSDGSTVTTMVAGRGYFINNSSAAGLVKLPASAAIGDTIRIKDYAGNFGTNKLTIQRNSHKIQGQTLDSEITTDRAALALVYVDATKGWLYSVESAVSDFGPQYVAATGGTVATSGDFKIHTFTGDSNFVVSNGGNSGGSNKVSYFVLGGGGGGGAPQSNNRGGGGGGGGFREGKTPSTPYTASPSCVVAPDGLPVSAQTYPITIGGGGAGGTGQPNTANPNQIGTNGGNSIFSTITSAGGGGGGGGSPPGTGLVFPGQPGGNGGGGGGGGTGPGTCARGGGNGNTPPVSPPQGSKGGAGGRHPGHPGPPDNAGGGGGGVTERGGSTTGCNASGGEGGDGATTEITGSPVAYGGGGAGIGSGADGATALGGIAAGSNGTANRGMGGPPGSAPAGGGKTGGSGIVVIRYKYQN